MHNCLMCHFSEDFQKPISMTTGKHLHLQFTCKMSGKIGPYGEIQTESPMIFDLITSKCWVDGSITIPKIGCNEFIKDKNVNDLVILTEETLK